MVEWSEQHQEDAAVSEIAQWLYELTELGSTKCERIARRIVAMADEDWTSEDD